MKYKFIRRFIFLLILPLLSRVSFATAIVSPEDIVNDFYHSYLSSGGVGEEKLTNKFVMPDVMNSINHSYQCNYDSDESASNENLEKICSQKRECKSSNGDYICNWDGVWIEADTDYFTKSQDIYPSWAKKITITPLEIHEANAEVKVSLGEYPDPVINLKVTLISIDHSWKINGVMRNSQG